MGLLINTPRLILRELRADDAEAIYRISNDPYALKWLPHLKSTFPVTETFIKTMQTQYSFATREKACLYDAITLKGSSELIGIVSLTNYMEAGNQIGINFFIAQEHAGQGYVTEAARAMIKQGFSRLGLKHIVALVHNDNFAAQHVLKKMGFTKYSEIINPNAERDDERPLDCYALDKQDFIDATE